MREQIKSAAFYLILMMVLGFGIYTLFLNPQMSKPGSDESTQVLFAANFPNELGESQALKQYQGKTIVLNFWATWCEPCRDEMPELSLLHETQASQNVVVLGIAVEDVDAIKMFSEELKVSYPLFAADYQGMDLAFSLGNDKGALPYTVIIQPDGKIHQTFFGKVSQEMIEESLRSIEL